MIRFKYRAEKCDNGGIVFRPIADVRIKTSFNTWIKFHPYIDSGADLTLIPYSLGKLLNLSKNNQKKEKMGGIAGGIDVINLKCKMKIDDFVFDAQIAWAQIEDVPALLGRADIFDFFDIEFKQEEKSIYFQRSKKL